MAQSISLRGSLVAGSGLCVGGSQGLNQCVRQLALGGSCDDGVSYQSCVVTATTVATPGTIGQNFEQLDCLGELSAIEFLFIQSSARVRLRVDARPSTTLGVGGIFPTAFVGGEVVNWFLDNNPPIAVTFDVADQSVEQVAARFNAAAALAGIATPRVVAQGGQLLFTGVNTGPSGAIARNAFTGTSPVLTRLGLLAPTFTAGRGGDVDVSGLAILQFPRSPNAPVRIDVSGVANLEIIAAGVPA